MTIDTNCLKGAIGEFTLADIIQLISLGGKSGRLLLCDDSSSEGSIYFECGYVVHARLNGVEGEAAARSLIALDAGTFEFDPGIGSRERSVMLTGHELLMRAAQSADEDVAWKQEGQLVLDMEDGSDDVPSRTKDLIKDLLQARLGRRSRYPVAALEASEDTMGGLVDACERIERYIALFIDAAMAEETGKNMRQVMGLI